MDKRQAVREDGSFRKWNWGAFTFNIWWGIANRVWLVFLMLVPLFNIIWVFILAYNGNKWAYTKYSETRDDREVFNYAQRTWNRAGFWSFIISIILIVLTLYFGMYLIAYLYDRDVNRVFQVY